MFEERKEGFIDRELRILSFWDKEAIFAKSLKLGEGNPPYTFFDGPPFATGLPHYGHLLAGIIKDATTRFWAMNGRSVERRFGWDCHGLPIENLVEKELGLQGGAAIEEYGIDRFNEACRGVVLRYTAEWKRVVRRIGRWIDMENGYHTMDASFMESVWWVFAQLFQKGLVYEGLKVMPVSTKLGTVLSNFEAGLNYVDVEDPSVVVKFPVAGEEGRFFLAWTTTPWTLPSNLALVVHPELVYATIEDNRSGQRYTLAEGAIGRFFKEDQFVLLKKEPGRDLIGLKYRPLFDFFAEHKGAFRLIGADFVTTEDGTGIVHAAPGHGEVDFYACQKEGIEAVCAVDMSGCFTAPITTWQGEYVKGCDLKIIDHLREKGLVLKSGKMKHRYPYCWRSDTPLIYKAVTTWFVAVEKLKDALVTANLKVDWVPEHLQEGRFGKWLENARDWAISRYRYWGTPIPLWRSADGDILVMDSCKKLQEYSGIAPDDLHRHFVDQITFTHQGKLYTRIPDVFDCWFESGSMPYAQSHYPFEKSGAERVPVPADFIAEGIDQTRGWFYTLMVLSVALFDKPAFSHVIVNGIVLAEDGTKMSKKLQNYPDPEIVLEKYGADSVRLYLLGSPATRAEDLSFSEKGVELVMRQLLIPLWNCYHFFATYARIYDWKPSKKVESPVLGDLWIISRLQSLTLRLRKSMESYHLFEVPSELALFIDEMTNWYIRRGRSRFWYDTDVIDQGYAFSTLYRVLFEFCQLLAPFAPMISEAIYQELRDEKDPQSVHLTDFPKGNTTLIQESLEKEMLWVMRIVNLGHGLRKEHALKVRQPLSILHIVVDDVAILNCLEPHLTLIADELNIKKVAISRTSDGLVTYTVKANFRQLGKKYGAKVPLIVRAIELLSPEQVVAFLDERRLVLLVEGDEFVLDMDDLKIEQKVGEGFVSASEGPLSVILETGLTAELMCEGMARELVSKINTSRKESGFEVIDRIHMNIYAPEAVLQAFATHKDYVMGETLMVSYEFLGQPPEGGILWDLNGEPCTIALRVVR